MNSAEQSYTIAGIGELLWDVFPDEERPGGAPANMAYHANALGNRGVVASRVGNDKKGLALRTFLQEKGIDTGFVQTDETHPTGTVKISFEGSEPHYEITEKVAWDFLELSPHLKELASKTDAVCFSTLSQRSPASRETIYAFLDLLPQQALKVLDINLRPPFFSKEIISESIKRANVVKLNEEEFRLAATLLETDNLPKTLFSDYGVKVICVTLGKNGSKLITAENEYRHAGFSADTSGGDAVGVGDAFISCVIHHLLRKTSYAGLLKKANAYASYVVTKQGGMPAIAKDILAEVT